jgi:D-alanyl-D-alanine carboxypeptidase
LFHTNYVLVRLLIERATGRSLADELQRLVLGPLGLTGTMSPGSSQEIPAHPRLLPVRRRR